MFKLPPTRETDHFWRDAWHTFEPVADIAMIILTLICLAVLVIHLANDGLDRVNRRLVTTCVIVVIIATTYRCAT